MSNFSLSLYISSCVKIRQITNFSHVGRGNCPARCGTKRMQIYSRPLLTPIQHSSWLLMPPSPTTGTPWLSMDGFDWLHGEQSAELKLITYASMRILMPHCTSTNFVHAHLRVLACVISLGSVNCPPMQLAKPAHRQK